MKKLLVVLSVLFFAGSLHAKDLSVGVTLGIIGDMAGMGETILKDGAVDLNKESLASAIGISQIIWADNEMGTLLNNAKGTSTVPLKGLKDQQEGSPMLGLNMEINCMYDFTSLSKLPLFARIGFSYALSVNKPVQKLTLGPGVDQAAALGGFPDMPGADTYEGGTAELAWHSNYMELPVTIGIILPVADKGKIYVGLGMSWFSGGWGIDAKFSKEYVAMLTAYSGEALPLVVKDVDTTIDFKASILSLHFLIGFEAFVAENVSVSIEYWLTKAAQNTFTADGFDTTTANVMTAAIAGPTAYSNDSKYLSDFAYPAVAGASMFKLGVKYYFL